MFPVSNNNLVPLCGSPAVYNIQSQMYGPRHSSPDPQFSFNSPRPPNVGPILGNQGQVPAPPAMGIGPHMRLFGPAVPSVPPPQRGGIPWGSGVFRGFPRPVIPATLMPQPPINIVFPNPTHPPVQPPIGQSVIQSDQTNSGIQHDSSNPMGKLDERGSTDMQKGGNYQHNQKTHSRFEGNEGRRSNERERDRVEATTYKDRNDYRNSHSVYNGRDRRSCDDVNDRNKDRHRSSSRDSHRTDNSDRNDRNRRNYSSDRRGNDRNGRDSDYKANSGAVLRDDQNVGYRGDRSSKRSSDSREKDSFHGKRSDDSYRNRHYSSEFGYKSGDRRDHRQNSGDRNSKCKENNDNYGPDRGYREMDDSRERYGRDSLENKSNVNREGNRRGRSPERNTTDDRGRNDYDRLGLDQRNKNLNHGHHSHSGDRDFGPSRRSSERDGSQHRTVLRDDRLDERPGSGAVFNDNRKGPVKTKITSHRGTMLIEDNDNNEFNRDFNNKKSDHQHTNQRGRGNSNFRTKGREDLEKGWGRNGGRPGSIRTGHTGALLLDDREEERPILRDDRDQKDVGIGKISKKGATGALLIEDKDRSDLEGRPNSDRGLHQSAERGDRMSVARGNRGQGGYRRGGHIGQRGDRDSAARDDRSDRRSDDNLSRRGGRDNVARCNRGQGNDRTDERGHIRDRDNVASSNRGQGHYRRGDNMGQREGGESVAIGNRGQGEYRRGDNRGQRGNMNRDAWSNRGQGDYRRGDHRSPADRENQHGNRHQFNTDRGFSSRGNSLEGRERSFSPSVPFSGQGASKRSRAEEGDSKGAEQGRFKRQRIEDQTDDPQTQCVRSGTPIIPDNATGEYDAESVSAWVRCSAADLYFRKDPKTGNLEATKRMQDLEKKFEQDLVQRASQIKAQQVPYERTAVKPKLNFNHTCKSQHNHSAGACKEDSLSHSEEESSGTDSDESEEEEEWWMEEVRHRQGNPYRMHKELWYNEPGELNYGPLCRCRANSKKFGIRHNIYPGEKPLPKCSSTSNNLDKLYHYKITVSPVTNFLTKHPTIINFDGHEYMFEGFSMFCHKPIPKLPPCQVIRFNIVYTIHIIEEQAPENFSVESLDLFAKFMFDEILELVDIDWKGPGGDDHCRRFHIMPRFARPFPENGKEVLSINDVFLYLLKASKPIIEPTELASLIKLDYDHWQHFVDGFRHMVVTCPGKRPSSIRIDQLDKHNCETEDTVMYPLIIHHGNRPPQLSYVGDNTYRKKWKEYLKFRHLLWTRTRLTPKDKDKLDEFEAELQKIRTKCTMKKEVSMEISSEGFLLTGIRSDMCQHAMMLPVLFNHVRFHGCVTELERRIGYTFKDKSLIQLALTHASYKVNFGTNPDHGRNSMYNCGSRHVEHGDIRIHHQHTRKRGLSILLRIMSKMAKKHEERSEIPHNERLEFLGDAVVEFITSIHLFYMLPHADEGELTMYRGALVQNAHFSILAEKLGLHEYLLYAHGPDLCHDSDLKHAMANCFEALMGALYLDGGITVADRVFSNALYDESDLLDIWTNLPLHPLQSEEQNGDRHWIENSPALQKLVKFENEIGYDFYNIRLLAKAFTQRSVGYNRLTQGHNQRLEFLGDTVMQLISSNYLFRHFPDHHEGHLTLLRSSLVNNKTQARVAEELGVTNYVLRSKIDEMTVILKQKEKADLLESVLGAMYVDGGIEPCTTLCDVCFFPRLEMFILNQDWNDPKSQLQQSCLTLRDSNEEYPDIPIYKVLSQSGPTNTRTFKVAVYFRGKRLAVGKGRSIQQGEMKAAETALHSNKGMFNVKLRSRMGLT